MVELFIMEYLTALGMTMVLLFLDSRYSRRRTILTVYGTVVLVMAAVAVLHRVAGIETTIRLYSLIAHVPSLLLFLVLSRFRGWRLVFQILSAILFCMLIHHETNDVRCPDPGKAKEMAELIWKIKGEGDTIGGYHSTVSTIAREITIVKDMASNLLS